MNRLPLLLLLGGCSWLRAERQVDPLTSRLQQADAAWRARATAGLEPTATALGGLLADAPLDGRVLWREARLRWLQGFLNPDPAGARNDWETGREYALGCLAGDPDVAASLRQGAWRISSASLSTTTPEQRPCLLWAAGNSLALVELRGSGGLLDAESACAMADRASQIVGPAEPGLLEWERGTCAWWLAGDPLAATLAWQQALASSGNYLYALAMVTHVPETPPELHDADEYALEQARALTIWAQRP